jgi:hypothetical protein
MILFTEKQKEIPTLLAVGIPVSFHRFFIAAKLQRKSVTCKFLGQKLPFSVDLCQESVHKTPYFFCFSCKLGEKS